MFDNATSFNGDISPWDVSSATNMDGGGSSVMGLLDKDGKMKIMNSPSDRFFGRVRIRPLPMILTITEKRQIKN